MCPPFPTACKSGLVVIQFIWQVAYSPTCGFVMHFYPILNALESISAVIRDREATLKVGALTSDSKWGGGGWGVWKHFSSVTLYNFQKTLGGGGAEAHPALRGSWLLKIMWLIIIPSFKLVNMINSDDGWFILMFYYLHVIKYHKFYLSYRLHFKFCPKQVNFKYK